MGDTKRCSLAVANIWGVGVTSCVARRFVRVYWVSWVRAFVDLVVVRPQESDFDFSLQTYASDIDTSIESTERCGALSAIRRLGIDERTLGDLYDLQATALAEPCVPRAGCALAPQGEHQPVT